MFKCEICEITFVNKRNLKRHTSRIHDIIKNSKCEFCEFRTSEKCILKQHTCYKYEKDDNGDLIREINIQKRLELETNGRSKKTPVGFIDILSETEVIEIKIWKNFKMALGQVMSYATYFPDRQKRIHLFGKRPDPEVIKNIKYVCECNNIKLTYEDDSLPDLVYYLALTN